MDVTFGNRGVIEDDDIILRQGADRKFTEAGMADLAGVDGIERQAQDRSNFSGDDQTAARQPENHLSVEMLVGEISAELRARNTRMTGANRRTSSRITG